VSNNYSPDQFVCRAPISHGPRARRRAIRRRRQVGHARKSTSSSGRLFLPSDVLLPEEHHHIGTYITARWARPVALLLFGALAASVGVRVRRPHPGRLRCRRLPRTRELWSVGPSSGGASAESEAYLARLESAGVAHAGRAPPLRGGPGPPRARRGVLATCSCSGRRAWRGGTAPPRARATIYTHAGLRGERTPTTR
jgi:hypothetical protein